jgi:Cys-rich protein (TIGR01571 family)
VMATCFPCITYGKNKSRLKYLQEHGEPHPSGGNTCTGDCWLHCCLSSFLPCCGWILQVRLSSHPSKYLVANSLYLIQLESRNQIRNRYSVDGGCGSDCVSSFFCSPCALTQEHQEMQEEEQLLMRTMGPNVKSSVKRSFEGRRP